MKIALLAPSGAGKTAYLTGLYGELARLSHNISYGIKLHIPDIVLRKKLFDRYEALTKGSFEQPSSDITAYDLHFTGAFGPGNRGRQELVVQIVDFPGEDLRGSSEERKVFVEDVIRQLSECDGFIVLLDGEKLIMESDVRRLHNTIGAFDVNDVLIRALKRRSVELSEDKVAPNAYPFSNGKTPIAFAVTKGDLLNGWLIREKEKGSEALRKKINGLFEFIGDPNNIYQDGEGEIANFIRSQFGQIIENGDIISIRTAINTFDAAREGYYPVGLEFLFQFVLFVGLRNARIEYERRLKTWKNDQSRKETHYTQEKKAWEGAVSRRESWRSKPALSQFWDYIVGTEDGATHNDKVTRYERDMNNAAEKVNSSREAVKQVEVNAEIAGFFEERVLESKLTYFLSKGTEKGGFYPIGLPLEELAKLPWWRMKIEEGRKRVNQGF